MNLNKILSYILLAIYMAIVPLFFYYPMTNNLVWTVLIPLFPITLLLLGYSRWRNVCPLAFFAKISQNRTFCKPREVSPWIKKYFYHLQFSLLLLAFSLRHWILNYDALALLIFLILIPGSAYVTGLLFKGKTWGRALN